MSLDLVNNLRNMSVNVQCLYRKHLCYVQVVTYSASTGNAYVTYRSWCTVPLQETPMLRTGRDVQGLYRKRLCYVQVVVFPQAWVWVHRHEERGTILFRLYWKQCDVLRDLSVLSVSFCLLFSHVREFDMGTYLRSERTADENSRRTNHKRLAGGCWPA